MIRLADLIAPDMIVDLEAHTKRGVLSELCQVLSRHPSVSDIEKVERAVLEREDLVTTGIGQGFAIPHVKIPEVKDYVIAVGRKQAGIEFGSLDGQPVRLVFMIGASERQVTEFVKVLARVVRLLKDPDTRVRLLHATIPEEFLAVVRADDAKYC